MNKREAIFQALHHQGALGKAADEEPVFVMRAQDMLADTAIDKWADDAEVAGVHPAKVQEARDIAAEMRTWPIRKIPD